MSRFWRDVIGAAAVLILMALAMFLFCFPGSMFWDATFWARRFSP